jgi:hypothetical protein
VEQELLIKVMQVALVAHPHKLMAVVEVVVQVL